MSIDRSVDTLAARRAGAPKTTGSLQPMAGRCAAQLTFTGTSRQNPPRYCMQYPCRGRLRCPMHGGKSLVGENAPGFRTGAYTRFASLPAHMVERLQASLANEHLLDLKPDIALLDVLQQDAARDLETGVTLARWRETQAVAKALEAAVKAGQKPAFKAALSKLLALTQEGADLAGAREEVGRIIERRTKTVKVHQQLQVETEDLIPAKRVGIVMAMMAALVREFIETDARRREFSERLVGLLGPRLRPSGQPAGTVVGDGE